MARVLPAVAAGPATATALTACAAPAGSGGAVATVEGTAHAGGFHGGTLDPPYTLPGGTFIDTEGWRTTVAAAGEGDATVVFFGYTHCPDICNTVLAETAVALRRAGPGVRDAVRVVFITTDPARDTPEVLRDYLDRFDPAYVGLTAPEAVVADGADHLDVSLEGARKLPGGGYAVDHGTPLFGFDAGGRGRVVWTSPTPVADLRQDLARLVEAA
ncbi:MAG: SCO family protein [Actinomycetota bacterium]|nr:SCO family protein [Actinomycetota bacterium]